MSVTLTSKDEKTITLSFPVGGNDLAQFVEIMNVAHRDGYELVNAFEIQSGHQRDPYTTGVRLQLLRTP